MEKKSTTRHNPLKESGLKENKGIDSDFEVRCEKVQKALIERFPLDEDDIKSMYEALKSNSPESLGEVIHGILEIRERQNIGNKSKNSADEFAKEMGSELEKVRREGITSVRKIADRFNQLNIKSFKGGEWSHNTVKNLIHRRRDLGLE